MGLEACCRLDSELEESAVICWNDHPWEPMSMDLSTVQKIRAVTEL